VMDNTLREKMKLSPDEAVARATEVIAAIKKVDGQFIGLWHESYLASSGNQLPWREAILRIIRNAAP